MLVVATALLLQPAGPSITQVDQLAKDRNIEGLRALITPASLASENPLPAVKSNGAYGVGRFGWRAVELTAPGGGRYVVLTTPMTSQDVGELLFAREGAKLRYIPERNDFFVYLLDHKMNLTLNRAEKSISVVDTVNFYAHGPTLPHFMVRLSPYLTVQAIEDANEKPVPFSQAAGIVAIQRPKPPAFTYTFRYTGKPNLPRYAGSFGEKEVQLANDYWYPMIARKPTPYLLSVNAPKDWVVVGQGNDLPSTVRGDVKTTRFRMATPITYWSLSAGEYKSYFEKKGPISMGAWSPVMSEADMKVQADLFAPVIHTFRAKFAPYPFERFGALVSPVYGGGALEAYSYATYGTGWLPDEDAHEPSHTWFGGLVNNTYFRSMWNESFADWADGYYQRESPIGNKDERRQAFVQDAEPRAAYNQATCAYSPPWIGSAAVAIGYGKGSKVLQMLEFELGTPMMEKTVQAFVAKFSNGVPANWEDYEKVVNTVSGRPMDVFFDQWLRRTGWAKFSISNVKWDRGLLGGKVQFEGKPYTMRLEALVEYEDGSRESKVINTTQTAATDGYFFRVKVEKKPRLVSFDPWRRVLRDTSPDEEPVSLRSMLSEQTKRYTDPAQKDYMARVQGQAVETLPADAAGMLIVGHPDSLPALKPLCAKAGFTVTGNKLAYKGTEIDLNNGGALAVVDLAPGKGCVIGLGKVRLRPNYGRARTALFDGYGRFLRGQTDPKTSGKLTFRL